MVERGDEIAVSIAYDAAYCISRKDERMLRAGFALGKVVRWNGDGVKYFGVEFNKQCTAVAYESYRSFKNLQ